MFAGVPAMTGAVTSFTVMVCVDVDALPQTSVAVHVLAMVYLLAHAPGVTTSATVIVTAPAQLSVAVTEAALATGTSPAHEYVIAAGVPAMTGGVASSVLVMF